MLWNGTAFNFETVMDVWLYLPFFPLSVSVSDLSGSLLTKEIGTLRPTASWSYFVGVVPQP